MWNKIKQWFGFGKKKESIKVPQSPPPAPTIKTRADISSTNYNRNNVSRTNYYRRNGRFYSNADDSLIENLMLVAVLTEMFDDNVLIMPTIESTEPETSVEEIDTVVESVRETYIAPEPSASYDSGSSYDSGNSYD